jgi:hypothetical protein
MKRAYLSDGSRSVATGRDRRCKETGREVKESSRDERIEETLDTLTRVAVAAKKTLAMLGKWGRRL